MQIGEIKDEHIIAASHYLIFQNKTAAYKFVKGNKNNNRASVQQLALNYFNSTGMKIAQSFVIEHFSKNVEKISKYVKLKLSTMTEKPSWNNKNQLPDLKKISKVNKQEAIELIEQTLRMNPNDAKIIKELTPLLTKLHGWDKEPTQEKSNIVIYELPKK